MGLVDSMAATAKGLKSAKTDGGFFYFVGDAKGENAALMVLGRKKDADGKKTFRSGRGLLKEFKKEHGKGLYSQGEIIAGSSLTFSITKGSAKPGIIKRAFKKSALLHEGVGTALVGVLKGAKIEMSGADSSSRSEEGTSESADLAAWKQRPEVMEMISDLELSDDEIAELFAAEAAFEQYADALELSPEEDTALQLRQAETEALLDELEQGALALAALREEGDQAKILAQEELLNNKRIELAQKNAIGPDPFSDDTLSRSDQESFRAAIRAGLALLLERVVRAQEAIDAERERLQSAPPDERQRIEEDLSARRSELSTELDAIQTQFQASRARG